MREAKKLRYNGRAVLKDFPLRVGRFSTGSVYLVHFLTASPPDEQEADLKELRGILAALGKARPSCVYPFCDKCRGRVPYPPR